MMSIVLQRPDFARARPSTLLTDDAAYNKLYNDRQDLATFYAAAFIGKKVDLTLRACSRYSTTNKSDILFYVIYVLCMRIINKEEITSDDLANIDFEQITEDLILDCAERVNKIYEELGGTDKIAKGPSLIEQVKARLSPDSSVV